MYRFIHLQLLLLAQSQPGAETPIGKGLEAAVSFAQSLSQWAYIIIGASVALLFKDSNRRPSAFVIHTYWVFIPGWLFLVRSIYEGIRVQSAYIAYLMSSAPDVNHAIATFNKDASSQVSAMEWGLGIFFCWLVIYLSRWILHRDEPNSNETLNEP